MSGNKNAAKCLFAFLAIGAVISGSDAKPPKRIWGGRLATDDEFPGIITLSDPKQSVHTCGGAIIGPRHILTAGHCVDHTPSDKLAIRAGIHYLNDYKNVVFKLIEEVVFHPDYIKQTDDHQVENDIAILVLEEPLPIGGRIQKLRLPTHEPRKGRKYTLAGFGTNHHNPTTPQFDLKVLNMTLAEPGTCQGVVPQIFCVEAPGGAACGGDSGSPLVQDGYVYGLVSTGWCLKGDPSSFTNVFNYVSWIRDVMRQTA